MEQDAPPERAGVFVDPAKNQTGDEILQHEKEVDEALMDHCELPNMEKGKENAGYNIGGQSAGASDIAEDIASEQDFFHKGSKKNDNECRRAGGIVNLGRDGDVVEISKPGEERIQHTVTQFVKSVETHKPQTYRPERSPKI